MFSLFFTLLQCAEKCSDIRLNMSQRFIFLKLSCTMRQIVFLSDFSPTIVNFSGTWWTLRSQCPVIRRGILVMRSYTCITIIIYKYLFVLHFFRLLSVSLFFKNYPGFARYQYVFPLRFISFLWWLDSGQDIVAVIETMDSIVIAIFYRIFPAILSEMYGSLVRRDCPR